MKNRNLWAKIVAFRFDDDLSELAFSQRLARENGWPIPFALRVIEEYRKFLYLAACSGHPVTPSDEVDQAWHLHLVYTQSYWQELCAQVLEMPLHHGPTKGGRAEGVKFHEWYAQTLSSYREEFTAEPPPEIWPPSAIRFSPRAKFQRVDLADRWLLSKSKLRRRAALALGAMATAATLIACAGEHDSGSLLITPLLLIGAVIVAIHLFSGNGGGKGGPNSRGGNSTGGNGCSSGGVACGSSPNGCGSLGGHSGCGADGGSSGCGGAGCGGGCGSS